MRRLSRAVIISMLAVFSTSSLQILAAPLVLAAPLDFYRYPLSHTGYYPQAYVDPSPQLHKRYGLVNIGRYGASKSSPLVDQGIIYVGADDGHLYAIREADMSLAWSFRVRPQARQGIHATPALDDKHVYIGAYDGWLYALNKVTGRLVWQTRLGDSIGSSAVIWGDRLYVGVETIKREGDLSCVNKNTGEHVYSTDNFGHHTHATPTINPDTATVFMGANSHRFFAIDANTGKLKWTYETGGPIKSTAALVEGDVLFTSWDGHLYKLSQQTGALVWRFKSNDQSMSSPAIDTDWRVVYCGSRDKLLYAVSLDDGKKRWSFRTQGGIRSSPIIVRNSAAMGKIVIFGSRDNALYGLDAASGHQLFQFPTQDHVTSVPLVKDQQIYVSGDDGWLYILH